MKICLKLRGNSKTNFFQKNIEELKIRLRGGEKAGSPASWDKEKLFKGERC